MPAPERRLDVTVLGAAGYVGGEVLRLLAGHPGIASIRAVSRSHAGKRWSEVHPVLRHAVDGTFEGDDGAARGGDAVFVALGHGESQRLMPGLLAEDRRIVVDLSADFRVSDETLYRKAYGEHACFDLVPSFVYALADVEAEALAGRRRLAIPGCFATACLLALRPLAAEGFLDEAPACFAVTGSSGAGAQPKAATHHPERAHNLFAYALDGHRHEAEIAATVRRWTGGSTAACRLLPHAGPFVRGIYATVRVRTSRPLGDPGALFRAAYAGRPFVHVLDSPPDLHAVVGTNHAHLHAVATGGGSEIVVTAAIDNLVKGAAGQALQAMNLALGFAETLGLGHAGIHPC